MAKAILELQRWKKQRESATVLSGRFLAVFWPFSLTKTMYTINR